MQSRETYQERGVKEQCKKKKKKKLAAAVVANISTSSVDVAAMEDKNAGL